VQPDETLERLAHATIGAAIEVHRQLGPGFLEAVYETALALELASRGIVHQRQVEIGIDYKGTRVGQARLDLLVGERLIVDALLPIHKAQLLSYLKALDQPLGLLINFKVPVLRQGIQRVIRSR